MSGGNRLLEMFHKQIFRAYHIYFSSTIDRQHLKELAESDVKEVVQTVQEIFADYNPYSGKRIGKDDVRLRDGRRYTAHGIRAKEPSERRTPL